MMRLAIPGAVLLAVLSGQAQAAETYKNPRFGITTRIPLDFQRAHTSASGDGATFNDASGAELDVFGYLMDLELEADMVERSYNWTDAGGEVTYQASGETWYVLSGRTADGASFYARHVAGETCDGEPVLAAMILTYDAREKPRIDPLIGAMAGSLGFVPCK